MTIKHKNKNEYQKFDIDSDPELLNFEFKYNLKEAEEISRNLKETPSITEDDLRRIALWKIDRVLSVSSSLLEKLNRLSVQKNATLKDDFVKEVIDELVSSPGIGFPMASAILKFVNPEIFPIIDVRAYRALYGVKLYYSGYTYEKYVDYSDKLHEIATKLKRPLRDIDEQLYCYDLSHNGKI